tara:strand:- start:164 stop:2398 length:2235 start_codon:yes stop_codon:yes gene_type:complete
MKSFLRESYDIKFNKLTRLPGYDINNYLGTCNNSKYIIKKYQHSNGVINQIKSENKLLEYLNEKKSIYPQPIKNINGKSYVIYHDDKNKYVVRLLSYLNGKFLGEINQTKKILESLGDFAADMNKAILGYEDFFISSRVWQWDIQHLHLNKNFINDIESSRDRKLVKYFFQQFDDVVVPVLPSLRKSIIHNDLNEWNILCDDKGVSGVIDFGDIAHTQLVNEVAIAMTYGAYDKDDPIANSSYILSSYHKKVPLTLNEISILYYLITAKLCMSVCNSAHSRKINPYNKYALISEKNAWKTLKKFIRYSPRFVENKYRNYLNIDSKKTLNSKVIKSERDKVISNIFSLSYDEPIAMERSAFQYMFDYDGNSYLDAYNNVPHVGHCHPGVIEAASKQMKKLNTNTRYLYNIINKYGYKLLKKFHKSLNKIYFVNSGSEASDLAIKLALAYSNNKNIMVMENGYHGHTQRGTDISEYKFNHVRGQGKKDYIIPVQMPTKRDYLEENAYINESINKVKNIAAFICEPILGCGGQVPLPKNYLNNIYKKVRDDGGVCISDEVQTGFGRLGKVFWGFELYNVIPDIVVLGKSMGNGHPIGAVITTDKIASKFSEGVEFFSSFGGNPVSCAIGLSVLDIIEEEKLQENAKIVGEYYKKKLQKLKRKYKVIGDIRGEGLFLGIEIISETNSKPDQNLAHFLKNKLRKKHILVGTDGPHNNVIKSKPPICFDKVDAKKVVDSIDMILSKKLTY